MTGREESDESEGKQYPVELRYLHCFCLLFQLDRNGIDLKNRRLVTAFDCPTIEVLSGQREDASAVLPNPNRVPSLPPPMWAQCFLRGTFYSSLDVFCVRQAKPDFSSNMKSDYHDN